MRTLIVCLLLSSCGPNYYGEPICVSRCGVKLMNAPPRLRVDLEPWTCEGLQRAEDLTEVAFQKVLDPRVVNYCQGISGWRVGVQPTHTWQAQSGNMVAGETYCDSWLMLVNNAPPDLGSFAHEAAHALQRCYPMSTRYEGGHADWESQGILHAIDSVWDQGRARAVDGGAVL